MVILVSIDANVSQLMLELTASKCLFLDIFTDEAASPYHEDPNGRPCTAGLTCDRAADALRRWCALPSGHITHTRASKSLATGFQVRGNLLNSAWFGFFGLCDITVHTHDRDFATNCVAEISTQKRNKEGH